jgi:hypothetical protein
MGNHSNIEGLIMPFPAKSTVSKAGTTAQE